MNDDGQRICSQTLPGIAWCTDADLRIVCCWGAGLSLFGAQADRLTGRNVAELLPQEDVAYPALAAHRKALQGEATLVAFCLDGQSFGGQVVPVGQPGQISGTSMLVAGDEPAQRRFETIAETAADLILCLQLDGTIDNINRTGKHLAREQIVGRSLFEFIPPKDHAPLRQAMRQVTDTGQITSLEVRFDGPSETEKWHAIRIGAVKQAGKTTCLMLVATDITELKRNAQRLAAEESLLRRLLDLQERERRMVAYEIHDGFIQDVIGARMMMQSLQQSMDSVGNGASNELACALSLLNRAINDGRRLISELRPMIIDEMGIVEAIEYLAQEESVDGLEIRFEHRIQMPKLQPLLQANLFRIAREAVTNARRHGQASTVTLRLTQIGEQDIVLEIKDNGSGFDPEEVPEDRFGLAGIRERARLFGGGATIESQPSQGTLITVKLPLEVPLRAKENSSPHWQWTI
jgi:PAS domain S-box-containing protein